MVVVVVAAVFMVVMEMVTEMAELSDGQAVTECGDSNPNGNTIDFSEPSSPGPFHDLTELEMKKTLPRDVCWGLSQSMADPIPLPFLNLDVNWCLFCASPHLLVGYGLGPSDFNLACASWYLCERRQMSSAKSKSSNCLAKVHCMPVFVPVVEARITQSMTIKKIVGDSRQPCRTPVSTLKGSRIVTISITQSSHSDARSAVREYVFWAVHTGTKLRPGSRVVALADWLLCILIPIILN
ncbi:hypothetical protein EGW08_015286 [Elysia chlorotica]|uniref:Uncharacterized protein n=1 Tax=Elysia chlorotica TaxID=188477 RepID=A0A3S0ZWF7_ELYCH|nr:hypothetical protein EGW08_015286 [Elysia chlorotica]